jgi:hypothetical protein
MILGAFLPEIDEVYPHTAERMEDHGRDQTGLPYAHNRVLIGAYDGVIGRGRYPDHGRIQDMHEENSNAGNPVGDPRPLSLLPAVKGPRCGL